MKLITEEVSQVEFITEGKGSNQKCYIKGIFLQSEQVNRNGRMYPRSIMEREVNRYNENFIQKGRALGELGHPDGPTVNLDRVSHKICELYRDYLKQFIQYKKSSLGIYVFFLTIHSSHQRLILNMILS